MVEEYELSQWLSVRWLYAQVFFLTLMQFDVGSVCRFSYYSPMHYSAKRYLAIACRLSVRLTVTLVDHEHIR